MVFQSYALFPHMNVFENVSYGLRVSNYQKKELIEKTNSGLELVGLAGYGDRLPSELSGGQQQRVAVARALVLEPQVLLFDEPLSNLDAKLRRQVREEIRELQTQLGLTVVYVTHDQEEALAVSDRIIVMRNAAIAQDGSPRELYEQPTDSFVADFIGEANIMDVHIHNIEARTNLAKVHIGNMQLQLPSRGIATGNAKLAVRPNRIIISTQNTSSALPATVRKSTYVGNHMEYVVGTEYGDWFAVTNDIDQTHNVGDSVYVQFSESGPVLLPN